MTQPPEASRPSFEEVYEQHIAFLYRSARAFGVGAGAVDDVIQDVFVVVHRRLEEHDGRGSLRSWLMRILFNVVRDHRRSRRKIGAQAAPIDGELDEQLPGAGRDPEHELALAEARRTLLGILDGMDDDQRQVFVLAEMEQMTAPEIAEAMEASVNTTYSRLRLARKHFSAAVERARMRDDRRLR